MTQSFIPSVIETAPDGSPRYGLMLVALSACSTCGLPMIPRPGGGKKGYWFHPFTEVGQFSFEHQVERAGWVVQSRDRIDGNYLCETCARAGKASFVCALCLERRGSQDSQEEFGDPAEHLCNTCYTRRPAAEWDAAVERLHAAHQWDFE